MWQVGRIKQIGIFLIIVLGIGYQVQAQDQTVKINIQLPAGVGLSAGGGSNSGSAAQGGEDGGSNRIANSVVDFAVISENGTADSAFLDQDAGIGKQSVYG